MSSEKKPISKAWYLLSPIVFLVFGIGGLVWLFLFLSDSVTGGHRFTGPGETVCPVLDSGKHYVWHHLRSQFDGESIRGSKELPEDVEVTVTDLRENAGLAFTQSRETRAGRGEISVSLGYFEAPAAGDFRISVQGEFETAHFSVKRSSFPAIIWRVAVSGVVSAFGWVGGPLLLLIIYVQRNQIKKDGIDEVVDPT